MDKTNYDRESLTFDNSKIKKKDQYEITEILLFDSTQPTHGSENKTQQFFIRSLKCVSYKYALIHALK